MANIVHTRKNNPIIRQLLFVVLLIAAGIVITSQLSFFVGSLLGAFTLYVVFRHTLFFLTEKRKWKPWLAAFALTSMCFTLLSAIGYVMFRVIAAEMPAVDASHMLEGINGLIAQLNKKIGIDVVSQDVMNQAGGVVGKIAGAVLNTTYSFAANIFMMLVIVYFMFAKGRQLENQACEYSPFKGESLDILRREVKNIVYSNAIGIPLIMIAQTLVSALIYRLIGMDSYLFWAFLTAVCGLVPLVGSALVYAPIAIYYAAAGEIWTGAIVLMYGGLIVSNADNVIRILLMRKMSGTHPLIVIFGVILGIPLFGFWGIIFGPLFLSAFFLLIRIYYMEYGLKGDPKENNNG